jgi:hypothetical protein
MTVLEDKLNAAKENRNNDVRTFVWKGAKEEINGNKVQKEIRLIDATPEQLQSFYNHCRSMLYNTNNKETPGRYVLLDMIKEQREKCNTELYLRFLEKEDLLNHRPKYPRINYLQDLRASLSLEENKKTCPKEIWNQVPIRLLTSGIPAEFANIPLATVIDGCLDCLGRFDKSHITLSFILKLGVWFKPQEMKMLLKKDAEGKTVDRLTVAKQHLGLKDNSKMRIDPAGLTLAELEAMVKLKSKKYSELTTDQLTLLRNKILFRLEDEVEFHISQWEERIEQIKKVAQVRGIELKYA